MNGPIPQRDHPGEILRFASEVTDNPAVAASLPSPQK